MGFLEERANLAGKVAVVTGGGGGLGRYIALDLARAGVDLALCDRDGEALHQTAQQIGDMGRRLVTKVIDVREPEALAGFFTGFDKTFDRLDVLVNVVGGTFRAPFMETNPRGWDALIRANFTQLLHATHMAATRMRAGGRGGSIINLTSIEAHRAAPRFAVYAGMKAGVANFARTLAVELAPEGIRVNNIAADMTPTEGTKNIRTARGDTPPESGTRQEQLNDQIAIPMGRKGRPEDIGNCALFLASDLSTYVTGQTLHPDGGALASAGWFNWPDTGFVNTVPAPVLEFLADR